LAMIATSFELPECSGADIYSPLTGCQTR